MELEKLGLHLVIGAVLIAWPSTVHAERQVLSLDGTWRIAQGSLEVQPTEFPHQAPVPGLVDMAKPAFQQVGTRNDLRQAFWYRREFTIDGAVPAVALLKIHKAKYGAKVFLNGEVVGEHLPCFTPVRFDIRKYLRGDGQENVLIVRVGADRESIPEDVPSGWDFEKYLYIPGIYDSVEVILSGFPFIENIQTVPNISTGTLRVVAEVRAGGEPCRATVKANVTEAATATSAGGAESAGIEIAAMETRKFDLSMPLQDCRLWSPEDPFLYRLRLRTGGDTLDVRFGMREFHFDRSTRRAMLNGQPYLMRGTNVCVYRFFEDAAREDLPWRREWVRALHRKFKSMHWNSIRYCIGFPPELWYDIADEEGVLIQDEFPIWLLGDAPEDPQAEKIIPQYAEWMRERWNHPCVVIWDAQNESNTEETGKALQTVRGLDLSERPWENGWAQPQSETDCVESHPYLFIRDWQDREPFRMSELANTSGVPRLQKAQKAIDVPIIINEYAWLWLDRDGQPTCLTDKIYANLLGPDSTVDQRRRIYARYLAALTEFWRAHRECAGVLHFCGLAYSRPGNQPRPLGGATSDHFLDLKNVEFEPFFEQYVRDAFNPLGIMLDFWADEQPAGSIRTFRIALVNDLDEPWQGEVTLRVEQVSAAKSLASRRCEVKGLERAFVELEATLPAAPGHYTLAAEIVDASGRTVRSLRDVRLVPRPTFEKKEVGLPPP